MNAPRPGWSEVERWPEELEQPGLEEQVKARMRGVRAVLAGIFAPPRRESLRIVIPALLIAEFARLVT